MMLRYGELDRYALYDEGGEVLHKIEVGDVVIATDSGFWYYCPEELTGMWAHRTRKPTPRIGDKGIVTFVYPSGHIRVAFVRGFELDNCIKDNFCVCGTKYSLVRDKPIAVHLTWAKRNR